jgi:hypothetical protein
VGSSRPRKMYSMMATTSGMLARKQMMVSTGTYCRSMCHERRSEWASGTWGGQASPLTQSCDTGCMARHAA